MNSKLTSMNRENIAKLIAGLKALPDGYLDFEMKSYVRVTSGSDKYSASKRLAVAKGYSSACGTSACIVGHGPRFGIPMSELNIKQSGRVSIDWKNYSMESFGINDLASINRDGNTEWEFCFSHRWPNSIEQAVIRLELFLNDRVPHEWDHRSRFTPDG